jgi:hypothetical protein
MGSIVLTMLVTQRYIALFTVDEHTGQISRI